VRDAAGELGDLQTTGHLADRVGGHLAVLGGDERPDALLVVVEQLAEGEQHLGPLGQRRPTPLGSGDGSVSNDLVNQCLRREVDLAGHLAGRRVEDITGPLGGPVPFGMPDEMGDAAGGAHARSLGRGLICSNILT
jgi:hypothetical protein